MRVLVFALLFTAIPFFGSAQVTIKVDRIPPYTPENDTLYLAGDFNNWNPGDKHYTLTNQQDGSFTITMPEGLKRFSYKITRGSWATVEGDINGRKINDRTFNAVSQRPIVVTIEVLSWEDIATTLTWNLVVTDIPENTPHDVPLFVSGSFNDWKEYDPQYKLARLDDGTYAVKIQKTAHDTIWYKFHRGSWRSVESRKNGRTQVNRVSVWDAGNTSTTITCNIAAWEDIGGGTSLFFTFFLSAAAIQTLVLIVSVLAVRNKNTSVTHVVSVLLAVTLFALVARLTTYNRSVFEWQPKLFLLADLIYFLYPPIFYILISRITGAVAQLRTLKWIFTGIFIIALGFYLPALFSSRSQFILDNIDGHFRTLFDFASAAGFVYGMVIWGMSLKLIIQKYQSVKNFGYQPSFSYLATLMGHKAILLLTWLAAVVFFLLARYVNFDFTNTHETVVDALWMIFSVSVYVHTFLLVRKPELFKLKDDTEEKRSAHQKENLEALKASLSAVMKRQRPFLNSKLGLQDLADIARINVHTLSWLINEGYNKNFFDFINEYRIEEFKRLVSSEQYKNYTFLAIAMEVGFSSKTTFNRAFKKATGKTPREYFNDVQESQLEGIS